MANRTIVLIPARMASTRLPGKPLADIAGEPMIVHVWRRAIEANIGDVVVAAGEKEIVDAITNVGGRALLTSPDHQSGSDRIYEALQKVEASKPYDIVVNLQGDLPVIEASMIARCLEPLNHPAVDIATLGSVITDKREIDNPNVVKIIARDAPEDLKPPAIVRAQNFTRTVPSGFRGPFIHHIGIYAYRRTAIRTFIALPQSMRENNEKLEQLRALDSAMRIDAAIVDNVPFGVDTPEDLHRARAVLGQGRY